MKRVQVLWIDSGAFRSNGWETAEEIIQTKIGTVETAGFLFHEDEDSIYVATSVDADNGHFYGTQVIHKPAIQSMKVLRKR